VIPFYPASKIIVITVGNEVMTFGDHGLMEQLLPAMQNLQNALNDPPNFWEQLCCSTQNVIVVLCVCVCCEGMMRECLVWFWCRFKLPENVRKVCAWAWTSKFFVNVEGITDISCVKNHVQVTCVRPRLMLTMEMDRGGEIERN
jgi:hypothetical protein